MGRPSSLPAPAETLALQTLKTGGMPMTAYAILERLKPLGMKSPPVIYRALEALVKAGKVHRVNTLGAYVACSCRDDHTHELTALLVCGGCGSVKELHEGPVMENLTKLRELARLSPGAVIELPADCGACR